MFSAESTDRMKKGLMQKANHFVSNDLKQCKYILPLQKDINEFRASSCVWNAGSKRFIINLQITP